MSRCQTQQVTAPRQITTKGQPNTLNQVAHVEIIALLSTISKDDQRFAADYVLDEGSDHAFLVPGSRSIRSVEKRSVTHGRP